MNNLGSLFRAFARTAQLEDGLYFLCRTKDIEIMGKLLTQFTDMSLEEKYKFVIAPIDTTNRDVVLAFLQVSDRHNTHFPLPPPLSLSRASLSSRDVRYPGIGRKKASYDGKMKR